MSPSIRLLEKDMEDLIVSNPEKYLEEPGLKLIERQYSIGNYRFDLLFHDRHGAKLIIEIQRGTLDRNHTYKILDYYDEYKDNHPNDFVDLMVVANKITQERRKRLQSYDISFKEIPESLFLNDPAFRCNENVQSKENNKSSINQNSRGQYNTTEKSNEENRSSKSIPQLNSVSNFEELCKIIKIRSEIYPTNYMDLLLLENEKKKLSEILEEFRTKYIDNNDFKSVGRIKTHIKYRENHDGWVYNYSGYENDPIVKLVVIK